jgi:uncharacterized RDD family membrane protein YckC
VDILIQRWQNYQPVTGPEIWSVLLWNFSVPIWAYFLAFEILPGHATIGKRIFRLSVRRADGTPAGLARLVVRNVVKLLPWELVHFSALSVPATSTQRLGSPSLTMTLASVLLVLYLVAAAISRGQRSIPDLVAGTEVVNRRMLNET